MEVLLLMLSHSPGLQDFPAGFLLMFPRQEHVFIFKSLIAEMWHVLAGVAVHLIGMCTLPTLINISLRFN